MGENVDGNHHQSNHSEVIEIKTRCPLPPEAIGLHSPNKPRFIASDVLKRLNGGKTM